MADNVTIRIGRRRFELSRPDKVLFPADGITKADLVDHYRHVAQVMLPHLKGRPLMLQRFPDGIGADGFYQKDVSDHFPDWIHRAELAKAGGTVTHVVCDDEATLAYLAGQACVTPHVWLSRADRPEHPDRLVFDLDPSGAEFAAVKATARDARRLLEDLGLVPFVQITGSAGLHVVVPLDRRADIDEVRSFARDMAEQLVAAAPDERTVEARKSKRRGRVYIDVARNAYAQTVAAPYAVRGLPGAPVATPLEWRELGTAGLTARRYTLGNIARRLARRDDPWADMASNSRALGPARDALEQSGPRRRRGGVSAALCN